MRLPHFIDYVFTDDDLLLDAKVRLAVIDKIVYNKTYEKKFVIRRIHHFGYHVFLGRQETVKAYFYDEPEGENGIKSIITGENQFLIPRKASFNNTSKVTLTNKNVYFIKKNDILKEVVLDKNNKPFLIDYAMEEARGFSDLGNGQKGRYYIKEKDYEVVIM